MLIIASKLYFQQWTLELRRERLLTSVEDFGFEEPNIEQTSIFDEAADYNKNEFDIINYL